MLFIVSYNILELNPRFFANWMALHIFLRFPSYYFSTPETTTPSIKNFCVKIKIIKGTTQAIILTA